MLGYVAGAIGLIASGVGLYEAFAPSDRSLHKLVAKVIARIRSDRALDIRTLISTYEMTLVSAGGFVMGTDPRVAPAQKAFSDEFPQHSVTISKPVLVGKRLVTQQLWEALMGTSLQERYADSRGPRRPIVGVSWFEAIRFCNEMSSHAGLTGIRLYRSARDRTDCYLGSSCRWIQTADRSRMGILHPRRNYICLLEWTLCLRSQ